ncbi:DUF7288 family protein [Halopenitus persicus]|uniref:DUF7288 family protein n=1 Tax=Halopenitus persicus TaxID=1048396 RepID=UPI000BBB59BB|nr:hypothetical protein [Halopenitus persicus]
MARDSRGQAHTLEAVAAAIVLLSAILFALQVTAVTPLSGSTSNQHIETQQAELAQGLLAGEAENGSLKRTLLYYNTSAEDDGFHGATGGRGQYDGTLPTGPDAPAFGPALSETFLERGTAVNVDLYYLRDGDRRRQPLIELGTPSDHAATATHRVTLFEADAILGSDGTPTDETVAEAASNGTYFVDRDVDGTNSPVFNVVEVEVTVWRM